MRFLRALMQLLLTTGFICVIVWAFWRLQDPQSMPVNNVQVEGRFQYIERAQIENLVAPLVASGFFAVDVSAIRKQLLNVAWVDDAAVYRVWPDTLVIKVVEQQPLAIWRNTEIVNQRGEVFNSTILPQTLPQLSGPPSGPLSGPTSGSEEQLQEVLWHYKEINRRLEPLGLSLRKLNLSDRFAWEGVLSNGFELILGRTSPLDRVDRFKAAYPVLVQDGEIEPLRVDLRYTNGFAVAKLP